MPDLSVTEEQLERFEALRSELEAAFVDGYGHVRRRDAVDYLLDTYTPPVEERVRSTLDRQVRNDEGNIDYPALQSIARNTEGVKGSGMTAEEMYAAVLEAKMRELESGGAIGIEVEPRGRTEADTDDGDAVDGSPGDAADAGPEGSDGSDEADGSNGTDGGNGTDGSNTAGPDDAEVTGTDGPDADTGDGSDAPDDGEGSGPATAASSNGGGGSQLQAMMNLLETHDGKWRKAASGDAPYEVDLPDGGTESARTKDDVKRILFTNY